MERILIVDDDENISMMLRESLEKEGFACGQAFSGSECLLRLSLEKYDLVLLDLMLPGIDGEQVLQEIRQKGSGVPVIVVSAKDDLDSKVDVLSIGADDYVTKPFEIKEVVARMRVQLRKRTAAAADTLSFGGIFMDREHFTVTADGAEVPKLTRQEYRILELLVQHPTRVYSKDAIYEYAWQEPYVGETKTLDVHMSNLRKKLKQVSEKEYIETIWGIGYRMKS
ncbi:MAG: response regulator transcription factor [Lachnospiraceae bacterium]|nr:response regulator transcription factor [Lachnospiraceae bacterium]MCR5085827.1 response regulator transcription factor [Lachnospiraceae bacterium]